MTEQAKNAIAVIEKYKAHGALAFVTREDCAAVTPLYKPEVTVITLNLPKGYNDPDADVYNISGRFMPKREIVDRIGEATGLVFIREGCRTWTETYDDEIAGKRTVYISEQQAKKRMSDGSWRTSSVQVYEFDPVMRAMIDFNVTELNAQTKMAKKDNKGKTLAQTILEYTKVARQRAETGARLRVIRELTNMPTAFSPADAKKPLVFGRFAQNTDYILQTPEGRAMASAQVLGIDVASLFGGRKLPSPESEITAPAVSAGEPAAAALADGTENYDDVSFEVESAETACSDDGVTPGDTKPATSAPDGDEFVALTQTLEQWVETYKELLNVTLTNGANPYNMANEELSDNNFNATVESRKSMIQRIKDFLKTRKVVL